MFKNLGNIKIYATDDLKDKKQVVEDLQNGNKVIVISSKDEILSIYGTILETFNDFNLYKVKDLSLVDDEYIDGIKENDRTKDEVMMFIGKTLSEQINEVIDRVECSEGDKIILGQIKEVINGIGSNTKTSAETEVLYKQIEKLKKENQNLEYQVNLFKTQEQNNDKNTNRIAAVDTINVDDIIGVRSKIIYIKELSKVKSVKTMIRTYIQHLKVKYGYNTKLVIIDDNTKYRYKTEELIKSTEQYSANRHEYMKRPIIVLENVYPYVINEALTDMNWQIVIIYDKICQKDIIKGKKIKTYVEVGSRTEYTNYKEKEKCDNITFIGNDRVIEGQGITIPDVDADWTNPKMEFYVYSQLENSGEDNRLIFDILDENSNIVAKEGIL